MVNESSALEKEILRYKIEILYSELKDHEISIFKQLYIGVEQHQKNLDV